MLFSPYDEYLQKMHLRVAPDKNHVLYLCYEMNVTGTEYKILKLMAGSRKTYFPASFIASEINPEWSCANVSCHISNINSKSMALGGRKIIKNCTKKGYFFNEEM